MGQFLPADHSKGDANTVGGYTAVHARPPAFEGKDGTSYSVEVMTDETGIASRPWAGYLLFVKWRSGDPVASGHVETDYLRFGITEEGVRREVGAMHLNDALAALNALTRVTAENAEEAETAGGEERGGRGEGASERVPPRPWYEVMREEETQ